MDVHSRTAGFDQRYGAAGRGVTIRIAQRSAVQSCRPHIGAAGAGISRYLALEAGAAAIGSDGTFVATGHVTTTHVAATDFVSDSAASRAAGHHARASAFNFAATHDDGSGG